VKNVCGQSSKSRYCLLAGLVAVIVMLLISMILHRSSIFQWNLLTWIAVLGIILAFVIGGVCACGGKDKK